MEANSVSSTQQHISSRECHCQWGCRQLGLSDSMWISFFSFNGKRLQRFELNWWARSFVIAENFFTIGLSHTHVRHCYQGSVTLCLDIAAWILWFFHASRRVDNEVNWLFLFHFLPFLVCDAKLNDDELTTREEKIRATEDYLLPSSSCKLLEHDHSLIINRLERWYCVDTQNCNFLNI